MYIVGAHMDGLGFGEAANDDGSGTGLGLAIAAEIAAGHGGTIAVERAPEGGLLIRYRLPMAGESPC